MEPLTFFQLGDREIRILDEQRYLVVNWESARDLMDSRIIQRCSAGIRAIPFRNAQGENRPVYVSPDEETLRLRGFSEEALAAVGILPISYSPFYVSNPLRSSETPARASRRAEEESKVKAPEVYVPKEPVGMRKFRVPRSQR